MVSWARPPGCPLVKISQTDDLETIQALDRTVFHGEELPHLEEATWWVATEDGHEVAYAGGVQDTDGYFFLCRAGVLPEARGQGLQRRLIRVRVQFAQRNAMRSCYTYTVPHNTASSNNLIRCGFTLWRPAVPWAGDEALYWYRRAAAAPARQSAAPGLHTGAPGPGFGTRTK